MVLVLPRCLTCTERLGMPVHNKKPDWLARVLAYNRYYTQGDTPRKLQYKNLSELAQAMEIPVSQIYRVRQGKCSINQKLIIGAIKAFPEYDIGDLFYFTS